MGTFGGRYRHSVVSFPSPLTLLTWLTWRNQSPGAHVVSASVCDSSGDRAPHAQDDLAALEVDTQYYGKYGLPARKRAGEGADCARGAALRCTFRPLPEAVRLLPGSQLLHLAPLQRLLQEPNLPTRPALHGLHRIALRHGSHRKGQDWHAQGEEEEASAPFHTVMFISILTLYAISFFLF